jgi:hypothetical protein
VRTGLSSSALRCAILQATTAISVKNRPNARFSKTGLIQQPQHSPSPYKVERSGVEWRSKVEKSGVDWSWSDIKWRGVWSWREEMSGLDWSWSVYYGNLLRSLIAMIAFICSIRMYSGTLRKYAGGMFEMNQGMTKAIFSCCCRATSFITSTIPPLESSEPATRSRLVENGLTSLELFEKRRAAGWSNLRKRM